MKSALESRKSLKPSTVRNLRRSAKLLVEYFTKERQLGSISGGEAENWKDFLVSKGFAPATVGRAIKRARQFFIAAMRLGLVESNPFAKVHAPQQVNDTRKRYVPEEVIYKTIDAAPNAEWRLIIARAGSVAYGSPRSCCR